MGKNLHITDAAQDAQDHLRGSIGMNDAIVAARQAGVQQSLVASNADDVNAQALAAVRDSNVQIG